MVAAAVPKLPVVWDPGYSAVAGWDPKHRFVMGKFLHARKAVSANPTLEAKIATVAPRYKPRDPRVLAAVEGAFVY